MRVWPVFGAFVKLCQSLVLSCAIALSSVGAAPGHAQELWHDTSLLSVSFGSARSLAARALGRGGYELADGTPIDLWNWYRPKHLDVTVTFLRRFTSDLGLIWGLSTGEHAPKYQIDPALHLGFAWRHAVSAKGTVSVTVIVPFWGQMREGLCTADYGGIGGVQSVNCRLAASELPPAETLNYIVTMRGLEDARLTLRLSWQF
jgi:hypothetical protein